MDKKVAIYIVIAVVALLFWYSISTWAINPLTFGVISNWLIPAILLILLSSLIGIALLVLPQRLSRLATFLAVGGPAVLALGSGPFFPGALAITFLLYLSAIKRTETELKQRIKIDVPIILRRSLPLIIAPIFLAISFAFYLSPEVKETANQQFFPENLTRVLSRGVEFATQDELNNLSENERQSIVAEISREVEDSILRLVGPYDHFLPPLLAFGFFLFLQGISLIFIWLAIPLGALIFWLMQTTHFISKTEYETKAEKIILT